jgi:drug/metabolite transporter (DMT)-like permease
MLSNKQSAPSTLYFLFLLVIVVWGVNWPMNKIGMEYMPAIWHAALRLGIATIFMFIFVGLLGKLKLPTKQDLPIIFTIGILQMGAFTTFINFGLVYVDAGRSSILVYTIPLWLIPLALIFFKEKMTMLKTIGFGLGMIGIFILFSPWSLDWSTSEAVYGHCILLLAAISFALAICCSRNMSWTSSPMSLLPWQLLVATIPVCLIALIQYPSPNIVWDRTCFLAMSYTGIIATAIGNYCATMISKGLPSITVSLGLLGVPLCGVISAAIILDETITSSMKLAMVFIFGGLICVALSGRKPKASIVMEASTQR